MVTETTCQTCWRIINHAFHHHHDIFWIIIINRLSREASCDTRAASIDITDTGRISIFDQRVGALNPLSRFFWHFRFWSNAAPPPSGPIVFRRKRWPAATESSFPRIQRKSTFQVRREISDRKTPKTVKNKGKGSKDFFPDSSVLFCQIVDL